MKYALYFIILVAATIGRDLARTYLDPESTFAGSVVESCFTIAGLLAIFAFVKKFRRKTTQSKKLAA